MIQIVHKIKYLLFISLFLIASCNNSEN
ncbi:uncharacterized protein METZ01_LOCUS514735, partial [marine metagenome]